MSNAPDVPGVTDQPTPVRAGQGFDAEALAAWLRPRVAGLAGAQGSARAEHPPELLQFGRGFSNLTYLVRFGDRELVVRRAPPGVNIKSAHDMGREFR
ncbi:MAG TPA: hypothetical protein VIY73_18500, partial [Polyangiaceae bacterium]